MRATWQPAVAVAALCLGCEAAPTPESSSAAEPTPVAEVSPPPAVDTRRCKPAPGTTGSPTTIAQAVALANGLPFPVTAECYVEALDRPLRAEATTSRSSRQPAVDERSPRVFLWGSDTFVTTVVLGGEGRNLIEFGQFTTPRRSVKGELEFPLTEPISSATAFDQVRNLEHPTITRCFVCHDAERDEPGIPGGRSSLALRPRPSSVVDVASLSKERDLCDPTAEPDRCRWLEALAGHGPIEHQPFDASLPSF